MNRRIYKFTSIHKHNITIALDCLSIQSVGFGKGLGWESVYAHAFYLPILVWSKVGGLGFPPIHHHPQVGQRVNVVSMMWSIHGDFEKFKSAVAKKERMGEIDK